MDEYPIVNPSRETSKIRSFRKSVYLHEVSFSSPHQFFTMKITFTITPRNTSFPVLIINELEYPLIPSIPREPFYSIGFSLRTSDRQKGILNLSGVIRGKSNSPIDLIIKVYINGANKAPTPIPFSGNYSNKGTFIFTTNVSLPKSPTGFQGRRQ